MSGITRGTTITQPAPPALPAEGNPNREEGLFGATPEPFNGDRDKVKGFICAFKCWWKLNKEKLVFDQPYKHVALCLSYMRGKKVDNWVDARQKEMDDNVNQGYTEDMEIHWVTFKNSFDLTYSNMREKMSAKSLKMEKQDIDTYIATFKNLLS